MKIRRDIASLPESLLRSPLAGTRQETLAPPAPRFPAVGRYRVVLAECVLWKRRFRPTLRG